MDRLSKFPLDFLNNDKCFLKILPYVHYQKNGRDSSEPYWKRCFLMKNQRIFPGIILIGFGTYFLLQQTGITIFQQFFTWPTLLIIVGIAFLGQGYSAKEHEAILPGVIMAGFGLHFHLVGKVSFWPINTIGMLILIISVGFFLRFQKTNSGLFQAFLFFILAFLLLFHEKITAYFDLLQNGMSFVWKFWPALLIVVGIYFLLKKKK
jgi:hypothetical protein